MNIWPGRCPSFEICPGLHSIRCMLNSISGIKCVYPLVVNYHDHFVEKNTEDWFLRLPSNIICYREVVFL